MTSEPSLSDRITDYLSNGGLFNPEMMEHNKVRDLLLDCRIYLDRVQADDTQRLNWIEKHRRDLLTFEKDGPYDGHVIRGFIVADSGIEHARDTARAAIDAAMTTNRTADL